MAYISVADAVERTGMGKTTIYRLCRKHEHTHYVLREDKKFLIDENFLSNQFGEQEPKTSIASKPAEPKQELIDTFIHELLKEKEYYRQMIDRKDEQLERNHKIVAALQERQRELYQLLHHQSRLLEEANSTVLDISRDEKAAPSVAAEESSASPETLQAGPTRTEIKTVYAVLAFVALLLTFAIAYHDEIRALVAE